MPPTGLYHWATSLVLKRAFLIGVIPMQTKMTPNSVRGHSPFPRHRSHQTWKLWELKGALRQTCLSQAPQCFSSTCPEVIDSTMSIAMTELHAEARMSSQPVFSTWSSNDVRISSEDRVSNCHRMGSTFHTSRYQSTHQQCFPNLRAIIKMTKGQLFWA